MTAQCAEKLQYQGNDYQLCVEPLKHYLASARLDWTFSLPPTALTRGYMGKWEIEADRLYLKALEGQRMGPNGLEQITLADLFPNYPDGIFAHWYSGELRCRCGARLLYVHGGFSSIHEEDLFLRVQHGVVIEERRVRNGDPSEDTLSGFNRTLNIVNWATD